LLVYKNYKLKEVTLIIFINAKNIQLYSRTAFFFNIFKISPESGGSPTNSLILANLDYNNLAYSALKSLGPDLFDIPVTLSFDLLLLLVFYLISY